LCASLKVGGAQGAKGAGTEPKEGATATVINKIWNFFRGKGYRIIIVDVFRGFSKVIKTLSAGQVLIKSSIS
jgi:hypothetical protein